MFSCAAVGLRNILYVGKRNKEVTETLATCQSPMIPLGNFPGIGAGYESGPHYTTFHRGYPHLAGPDRYEQAWE